MIRSKVLQLAAVAALIVGVQSAQACSTAAWTGAAATATAGEPSAGHSRYSGRCSLRATAANQTVVDNSPSAESTFKARFYFFTGDLGGGEADIYNAENAGGTDIIRVTYDGSLPTPQLKFYVNGTATTQTVNVAANRYYGIEVRWAASGTFSALVKGNAAAAATTVNISGFSGGAIDTVRLGWISGGTLAGGNAPNFDEYDSRRTSDIGFLLRGDASNDGQLLINDAILIRNEIGGVLAVGQPDCTEDGFTLINDAICVRNQL